MVGQSGNRVLLVDEPLIRKLISGQLVAAGYVVQTASDGLDALGKLRAELPDLIISDLNMPRMSGFELLAIIHKRFPPNTRRGHQLRVRRCHAGWTGCRRSLPQDRTGISEPP